VAIKFDGWAVAIERQGGREQVDVAAASSPGPGNAMDWIFDTVAPDAAWLTDRGGHRRHARHCGGPRWAQDGRQPGAGGSIERRRPPFTGPTFVLTHRPPDP
jgi:hypothetical protein